MAPNVHSGINTQQLSECVLFVSVFHTHPRATELLYAVNSTITTGMIPQGAALNSEDPGASPVAQLFFRMSPDIVGVSLGDVGGQEVAQLASMIPDTDECLQRCGLARGTQPMAKQDSRVPGNAFLSGVSAGVGATASSTSYSRSIMQTADLVTVIENPVAPSVICISATVASFADITTCNELTRGLEWIRGCWEQQFCVQ
ncbi:hypothetical protein BKA93DRAFT_746323 [Sparassis latifolia]